MKKVRVAILFGGRSAEHEISLLSARNVYNSLDKNKYEPVLVGIDKQGQWCLRDEAVLLLDSKKDSLPALAPAVEPMALVSRNDQGFLTSLSRADNARQIDVVFPVLHGTYGEDGTMQGLLKLADIPFVGPSVLGSAVGMDKDVMKRLLRDAGIPIADFVCLRRHEEYAQNYDQIVKKLGLPLFVKPANLGSSVGVSRVQNQSEFNQAVENAFKFDSKVIVEEAINGRELECAVLGNEQPMASGVGEIVPSKSHGFYSYEAKYLDENGAQTIVRAKLEPAIIAKVQALAIQTFQVLCCEGLSRVDCFLRGNDEVLVNEINTIPGFTSISMYPKLWEASGVSQSELMDRLITLALQRHERDKKLRTSI